MEFLIPFTTTDISFFVSKREGETKIGQDIQLLINPITKTQGQFVLVGIPEDIGPRANYGNGGARFAWNAFLSKFLNMQSTKHINAREIIIAGEIDLKGIEYESEDINILRKGTEELDKRVKIVLKEIVSAGKTPIIIGGGHNNCFPIISSFSFGIDVLNIDPHADIRKKEGRHSGNGFTFSIESGALNSYFVLGMHLEYNSQYILNQFDKNDKLNYLSFNTILNKNLTVQQQIQQVKQHLTAKKIGLEIDLDSIKNMPVSAKTPVGYQEEEIRKIVLHLSDDYDFHYLHICEGAPKNEQEKLIVGKTIAYLVYDFISKQQL